MKRGGDATTPSCQKKWGARSASTPPTSPGSYFFFFAAFFLAAFFFAGIECNPPFQSKSGRQEPFVNLSGLKGLRILAVG